MATTPLRALRIDPDGQLSYVELPPDGVVQRMICTVSGCDEVSCTHITPELDMWTCDSREYNFPASWLADQLCDNGQVPHASGPTFLVSHDEHGNPVPFDASARQRIRAILEEP